MNYSEKIAEDLDWLQDQEKRHPKAFQRDRIRFLRLLKSGQCRSQAATGALLGLSLRQAQRLWLQYCQQGYDQFINSRQKGYWGRLSSTQISQLRQYLLTDQAQTLADIQSFLRQSFGVEYTIGGVSVLCSRLKIKRKKGRSVHVSQNPDDIITFKKNLLN
jgi:transposase